MKMEIKRGRGSTCAALSPEKKYRSITINQETRKKSLLVSILIVLKISPIITFKRWYWLFRKFGM